MTQCDAINKGRKYLSLLRVVFTEMNQRKLEMIDSKNANAFGKRTGEVNICYSNRNKSRKRRSTLRHAKRKLILIALTIIVLWALGCNFYIFIFWLIIYWILYILVLPFVVMMTLIIVYYSFNLLLWNNWKLAKGKWYLEQTLTSLSQNERVLIRGFDNQRSSTQAVTVLRVLF